jgi:Leucine-rich repeat (LRR) protein
VQGFDEIRDPGGNPQATEQARAQALRPIVEQIREFQLIEDDVTTLGHLADMVPGGLEKLWLSRCGLIDIRGIGRLRGLRELTLDGNHVSDISELAELEGLRVLDLSHNAISDLTPLQACTELESLNIAGNQIMSLAPLESLSKLKSVTIAQHLTTSVNDEIIAESLHGNPVISIEPLRAIPALSNPFLAGEELAIRSAVEPGHVDASEGVARRVGRGHVFQAVLRRRGEPRTEEWTFLGVFPFEHPNTGEVHLGLSVLVAGRVRFFTLSPNDRSKCVSPGRPPGQHPPIPFIEVQTVR